MPTAVVADPENQEPVALEDLRVLVATELRTLAGLAVDAANLAGERHSTGPGFMSAEQKRMLSDQYRKDKRAQWEIRELGIQLTGHVPAPANVAAISLAEQIERFIRDLVVELRHRWHQQAGVCLIWERWYVGLHEDWATRTGLYSLADFAAYLLQGYRRRGYLEAVHRDAVDLTDRARRYLIGEQVMAHPEPCPWCHRRTLTVNQTTGVIACGEDRDTGAVHPCVCSDTFCPCKSAPVAHRHTWHRALSDVRQAIRDAGGNPDDPDHDLQITEPALHRRRLAKESWHGLSDLLEAARSTTTTTEE